MIFTVFVLMIGFVFRDGGAPLPEPDHAQVVIDYYWNKEDCEEEANKLNKKARLETRVWAVCQKKDYVLDEK